MINCFTIQIILIFYNTDKNIKILMINLLNRETEQESRIAELDIISYEIANHNLQNSVHSTMTLSLICKGC